MTMTIDEQRRVNALKAIHQQFCEAHDLNPRPYTTAKEQIRQKYWERYKGAIEGSFHERVNQDEVNALDDEGYITLVDALYELGKSWRASQ